jgi:hypothetical protein
MPKSYIWFLPTHFMIRTLYTSLISFMGAPFFAHPILLDLIVLIVLGEEYKLRSFWMCNFMHLVLLLASVIQMSSSVTHCHTSSTFMLPLQQERKFYTCRNAPSRIILLYISIFLTYLPTSSLCPIMVAKLAKVRWSHTFAVLSMELLAIRVQSWLNKQLLISSEWPVSIPTLLQTVQ